MTRQAVEYFAAQTYPAKRMIILDTGLECAGYFGDYDGVSHHWTDLSWRGKSIGTLRNEANARAVDPSLIWDGITPEIICHWDSDDWSHPNRIAEQVALLQSSKAECVGYNEMLFWRVAPCGRSDCAGGGCCRGGEAWLYTNRSATWALGTSLCYWRRTWERAPFAALNSGEDTEWFNRVKVMATHSFVTPFRISEGVRNEPRMVARIHAGNAGNPAYWPAEMAEHPHHWRRVPEWDGYCREVFAK